MQEAHRDVSHMEEQLDSQRVAMTNALHSTRYNLEQVAHIQTDSDHLQIPFSLCLLLCLNRLRTTLSRSWNKILRLFKSYCRGMRSSF